MGAGEYNRRITLLRTSTTNGGTGWIEAEAETGKVWASRKDASDSEKIAAGAAQGTTIARFVVRSSTLTRALKPQDRFLEGGRSFEVTGLKEIGRRDRIEITAEVRLDL